MKTVYLNIFVKKDSVGSLDDVFVTKHASRNVANSEFFEGYNKLDSTSVNLGESSRAIPLFDTLAEKRECYDRPRGS